MLFAPCVAQHYCTYLRDGVTRAATRIKLIVRAWNTHYFHVDVSFACATCAGFAGSTAATSKNRLGPPCAADIVCDISPAGHLCMGRFLAHAGVLPAIGCRQPGRPEAFSAEKNRRTALCNMVRLRAVRGFLRTRRWISPVNTLNSRAVPPLWYCISRYAQNAGLFAAKEPLTSATARLPAATSASTTPNRIPHYTHEGDDVYKHFT